MTTTAPGGPLLGDESVEPEGSAVLPGGGGWLRIFLAIAVSLTMFDLFAQGRPGSGNLLQWLLMLGVGLWVVMRPGSGGPAVLLLGALVVQILVAKAQLDGRLIGLVVLLPLVHQLSALSAVVPLHSTVRWAALLPTLLRYLGAVLVTVLGLLISHWVGAW